MTKIKSYQVRAKALEDSRPAESSNVQAEKPQALSNVPIRYGNSSEDGVSFLQSFLNATPLFNLFEYIADHTYGGDLIYVKVAKLKLVHPRFYLLCTWGDLILRTVVVIALVVLACGTAFKLIS